MGNGVRVVDRSLYHRTRDTQRTFRLSRLRAQVPSTCQQQQALLVHSVQVVGGLVTPGTEFTKMVSGFVEVVLRAFLKEPTISESYMRTRAVNFLRPNPRQSSQLALEAYLGSASPWSKR